MSERTIQPCAAKGCRHSAVGSVLVTRDPGRLPYSLWVCEGHRSLLMKAEAERKAQKPATVAPKFSADSPCPGSGRMWTPRRSDALPHAPAIPAGAPPAPEELMPKAPPIIKATIKPDLCKIEGCDRQRHARGLCSPHWAAGKNHGWLDQIGDPKKAPGPQKLPRPAPAGAEKALAEISRIQRERAAPTLAEAAALANKIAEAEIGFVPPADAANKKPVDLGDVPGWPPATIVQHYADFKAKLSADLTAGWPLAWALQRDTTDGRHDWICPVEASPLESGDGWVHSPVADLAVRWVDGARYPWMLFVLDSEGDELFEVEANTPAHLRTMYAAWQVFPVQQDGFSLQRQFSTALERAWDREWILEADNNQPLRWISRNLLNGQTSLIVWWDDAWHWHAVDGDRLLALGAGEDTIAIYDQYQAWNKGTVVVDNDWDGAIEKGGGDSDSLISGVVGVDFGTDNGSCMTPWLCSPGEPTAEESDRLPGHDEERGYMVVNEGRGLPLCAENADPTPTIPADVAATVAEAQLAEAGRLAVQVEGLQADLARANTEIKHLQEKLTRAEGEWDDADKELEEAQAELKKATERIAELEGVVAGVKKHRDTLMVTVATVTACHQRRCSELEAAQWMLAALGIKADSVVGGIQQLAQLPGNVLARRWAAWSRAQELLGQAEAELRAARGEVDDA